MVGRSTLLHASILLLLVPAVGADRVEDEAGDQTAPFPAEFDVLSVEVSSAGQDLVVTYQGAADLRAGAYASYQVRLFAGDTSFLVACSAGSVAGAVPLEQCWTSRLDPFESTPLVPTWSEDGTTWTLRFPLATYGLSPSTVLDGFEGSSRTAVYLPGIGTVMPPVPVDTVVYDQPFRLSGA